VGTAPAKPSLGLPEAFGLDLAARADVEVRRDPEQQPAFLAVDLATLRADIDAGGRQLDFER
jgi:hypothetical protein